MGSAVATRLITEWELLGERAGATPVLRWVAVRDLQRRRDVDLRTVPLLQDPAAVVDDPSVDIVVELMGGLDPATALIERALQKGKTVVTANKAVIATHGPRLARRAEASGAALYFEGAVGAGLPVLGLLGTSLLADRIRVIESVINGTTNVILSRMQSEGVSLPQALREAQQRGYAEADPSADVDGWDAVHKLVIMSWLAFGIHVAPEHVDRRGITALDVADVAHVGRLGYSVKLLARAERMPRAGAPLQMSVRPTALPAGHPLHDVNDADNSVIILSDLAERVMLSGVGAGGPSTASAVVSDIVRAVRGRGSPYRAPATIAGELAGAEDVESAGYARIVLGDVPEARSLVLQALEDRGVSVDAAIDAPPDTIPRELIVLTGAAPRAVQERALETLDTLSAVREIACVMDRLEPA